MIKKFECWNCHKTFEAEEKDWVECSHCHSDNVEYASWHMPKSVKRMCKYSCGVFFVAGICVGAYNVYKCYYDNPKEVTVGENTKGGSKGSESHLCSIDLTQQPILKLVEGSLEFDGEAYSCEIEVKYPPTEDYMFVIVDAFDENKIIAESNNNKFEGVPYTEEEGGAYNVMLLSEDGKTKLSSPQQINGFIKQVTPTRKMTVLELQTLIDEGDPSKLAIGECDYLSPELKIKFIGLPSDTEDIPTKLYDVYEKVYGEHWLKAKVTKLEYDKYNRIEVVYIQVADNKNGF